MSYCKANSCYNNTNYSYDDYCSYHEKCLSKLRERYSISNIREVETFETWFNKNCGYVINCDYSSSSEYPYRIWIVVYEPAVRSMGENLTAIKYKCGYGGLSGASGKARRIKNKLQNNGFQDTPMLKVHPEAKNWEYFSNLITNPYVISENLPCDKRMYYENGIDYYSGRGAMINIPNNEPEKYLKPLDIVKSNMGDYHHVGVYLGRMDGEYKVCHFSKKVNGTRIHPWKEFVEGNYNGEVVRYHPMIPFKYAQKIVKQINWVVERSFWEDRYVLHDRNCEHLANMLIYGINYSEQVEAKKTRLTAPIDIARGFIAPFTLGLSLVGGPTTVNNDKGSTIKLTNEMRETDDKLGYITNGRANRMEMSIEVPPKQNERDCCKVM